MGEHLTVLLLVPLLMSSAFFSGSEVALFSIDPSRLTDKAGKGNLRLNALKSLLESPRKVLVTILVGNTLVNILSSIVSTIYTLHLSRNYGWNTEIALLIQLIIITIIVLIFGEIVPKVFASRHSMTFAIWCAIPLYWVNIILYPVSEILSELTKILFRKLRLRKADSALTQEEIHHLASMGHEKGTIDEDEHDLIRSVVDAKDTIVREIMTHRTQMVTVSSAIALVDLIDLFLKTSYSRIPVYKGDIDHIVGVIYAKDVLRYLEPEKRDQFSLSLILRKPLIVPETKYINDLMKEFQEKKLHLAIVVDEYGGTAGIVTLEDIIQEVIGELRDEITNPETEIVKQTENMFLVAGNYSYKEFCDYFSLAQEDDEPEFDTLAGWILNKTGVIPQVGFSFSYMHYRFSIKEVTGQRIKTVQVQKEK